MKRRPILRGKLSAGVLLQLVLLLCSASAWAQSSPDITSADPANPLGIGRPDFSSLKDDETKPEKRVLPADHAPGDVHGVIRYPGGLPMAGAQVFILNADVDVERSTVSADDGSYSFRHLKPGTYQIGARIDGYTPSRALTVNVIPGQDASFDVSVGSRQSRAMPGGGSPSAYRAYGQTLRAEPASLRLGAAEPAPVPATNAEPGSATEAGGSAAATDAPKTAEAPATSETPTAVADELAAMRKRIDELEAELKGRNAAEPLPIPAPTTPAPTTPAAAIAPQGAAPAPAAAPETPKPGPGQYLSTAGTVTNYYGDTDIPTHPSGWEPFSYADWTWMNANGRNEDSPWSTKYFTPEFRADVNYMDDFNHPRDNTMGGSTESFRSNEWQLEQLSLGGNINIGHVRGRILTMFGLFSTTTPRNDGSVSRGQWDLANAYRYISEGWGGYHLDNVGHGLNIDAGIFVSYIGLFSYYNFDNWTYQPSYVSSNTPWFFNGLRIQYFPTAKLKIEPWIVNGWQSYARFNSKPGLGGQILWRPKPWFSAVFNNYGMGTDVLGSPNTSRIHTDDSIEIREFSHPNKFVDLAAMSLTGDMGCQYGGGQNCFNDKNGGVKTSFLGWMAYERIQFDRDHYGITLGGGQMNNPGRYLTLLPPINGANAYTGSPYFTENVGDKAHMYDATFTADYMPSQWLTFRSEIGYRHSDVPYWSGRGGITPPNGNNAFLNTGAPASYVCTNGLFSEVSTFAPSGSGFSVDNNMRPSNGGGSIDLACATQNGGPNSGWYAWAPDLRKSQIVVTFAIMTRF
jgi:Putative beta-barrel porin-2, OmpL-like. bbp2/Carboxypeptidase regulatory-like domain